MTPTLIVVIAAIVLLPLVLGILFKVVWKVPSADQALIVTGFGVKGRPVGDRIFKIVTGGGALVVPVMQKAQYLGMSADKAMLEVEGVDVQKIPVGVRGVAIFKVGDDERSITNAGTRFLDAQQGQMHDLVREVFHGHLRSIIGGLSVEDLIANRIARAGRPATSAARPEAALSPARRRGRCGCRAGAVAWRRRSGSGWRFTGRERPRAD